MGFPITIALLGFVAYGCWQLGATTKDVLMVLPVPLLMFALNATAFIFTSRKIKRLSDDTGRLTSRRSQPQFRYRGSRRESAVAQLSTLGMVRTP